MHANAWCILGKWALAGARRLLSPSAVAFYVSTHDRAQGVLRVLRACKCRRLDRVQMQLPPASPLEELSLAGAPAGPAHVQGLGPDAKCTYAPPVAVTLQRVVCTGRDVAKLLQNGKEGNSPLCVPPDLCMFWALNRM